MNSSIKFTDMAIYRNPLKNKTLDLYNQNSKIPEF